MFPSFRRLFLHRFPLALSLFLLLTLSAPPALVAAQSGAPTPPKPTPEVRALLDQGNKAFDGKQLDEAERLYAEALALARARKDKPGEARALINVGNVFRDRKQPGKALEQYEQSLTVARAAADKDAQGMALYSIGYIHRNALNLPDKALVFLNSALTLFRETGNKGWQGRTLLFIGSVSIEHLGLPNKTLEYYRQALALFREIGDKEWQANTLLFMGGVYIDPKEPGRHVIELEESLAYLEQARSLFVELKNKQGERFTLSTISGNYLAAGQPDKAQEALRQALKLTQESEEKEAENLLQLGRFYRLSGDVPSALASFEQALLLFRKVKKPGKVATALSSIGDIYGGIGEYQIKLTYCQEALPLFREAGDVSGEADVLQSIGSSYAILGDPNKTLEYYKKAISLLLKLLKEARSNFEQANYLFQIGGLYFATGQPEEALKYFRPHLAYVRQTGFTIPEAVTLSLVGHCEKKAGRLDKALAAYQEALRVRREMPANKELMAGDLNNIAEIEEGQGHLLAAERHLSEAVGLLETVRESLGGLSEFKVSFVQSYLDTYHRYIALLLRMDRPADAFAIAQKTKARALLDLLYDGKVVIGQNMTEAERKQERQLRQKADDLSARMVAEGVQNEEGSKARFEALKVELARAERELQQFTNSLYARHPDLARKRAAKTVTLAEVARFLPADTALLEYVTLNVGEGKDAVDRTVLFVVTVQGGKAQVTTHAVPIERAALTQKTEALRQACADPEKTYREQAQQMYRLLIAPAAKQIAGKKRLLLCPDGPLWDVPFAALIAPDGKFLLERYELSYSYSTTGAQAALAAKTDAKRARPTGTLLALANPNFGDEKRFGNDDSISGQRPIYRPDRSSITKLPGTQREADALKKDFPNAAIYTWDKAQESLARREAGKYRFVHLASHAFFNDGAPLLSSVVLADPPKDSAEDGFLTAREIFDLDLSADMVVLSACSTARGEKRSGEGVVGMTWALFVAGAPTQVLSQWNVDDASTATLMERFYRGLANSAPKGAALREAELALLNGGTPQHRHPYYWAPFVLVGDWR